MSPSIMLAATICCCRAAENMFGLVTEFWGTLNMGERLGAKFGRAAAVIFMVGAPGREAVASCSSKERL